MKLIIFEHVDGKPVAIERECVIAVETANPIGGPRKPSSRIVLWRGIEQVVWGDVCVVAAKLDEPEDAWKPQEWPRVAPPLDRSDS